MRQLVNVNYDVYNFPCYTVMHLLDCQWCRVLILNFFIEWIGHFSPSVAKCSPEWEHFPLSVSKCPTEWAHCPSSVVKFPPKLAHCPSSVAKWLPEWAHCPSSVAKCHQKWAHCPSSVAKCPPEWALFPINTEEYTHQYPYLQCKCLAIEQVSLCYYLNEAFH